MSKTPIDRYDEIKREIIQISEIYTLIKQNRANIENGMKQVKELNSVVRYEQRHMLLLYMRLSDLIKELNSMNAAQEITISLLYKNAVNSLKSNLLENCGAEYQIEISTDIKLNQCLF